MKNKEIKHLVIVGGGSSAMLAAAYIKAHTNYDITMVDRPDGKPIGVGEATILNFEPYMQACGFPYQEWFDYCDATIKTGILFSGWGNKKHSPDLWHPFIDGRSMEDFYDNDERGYHIDCLKLAKYIEEKLKDKVNWIKDNVIKLYGDTLICENKKIKADLFIDCTGFRSMLQKEKTVNLRDRLICDTAIAGPVEYKDDSERLHYTTCHAVSCGWIWKTPVRSRIGSGIIFNRSITKPKEAKKIFLEHWDNRPKIAKEINWTPYYKNTFWKNNVVRIGLAGGFIEPLESTGLALAMEGAYQLVATTRDNNYNQNSIDLYNSVIKHFYEDAINFISLHYNLNNRKEKFWKEAKKLAISNAQKYYSKMDNPKQYPHSHYSFFNQPNWLCLLDQLK